MKLLSVTLILLLLTYSCSENPQEPIAIHMEQRSTFVVEQLDSKPSIELGDITQGLVFTRVTVGDQLLASGYLGDQKNLPLKIDGENWMLRCVKLDNHLIGKDFADFSLEPAADAGETTPAGHKEIYALIEKMRKSGLTFIRNGDTHTAEEAADFMKGKWERSSGVDNGEQFISEIATKSSTSGLYYEVVLKDGSKQHLCDWLRQNP